MKIYISHSSSFDYKNGLYQYLKKPIFNGHDHHIFFPHDRDEQARNTIKIIESSDFILAEVSYSSTGQGIELAWAHSFDIPIYCIYKSDKQYSSSLKIICDHFFVYTHNKEIPGITNEIFSNASSRNLGVVSELASNTTP